MGAPTGFHCPASQRPFPSHQSSDSAPWQKNKETFIHRYAMSRPKGRLTAEKKGFRRLGESREAKRIEPGRDSARAPQIRQGVFCGPEGPQATRRRFQPLRRASPRGRPRVPRLAHDGQVWPRMAAEAVLRPAECRWVGRAGELSAADPTTTWRRSEDSDDNTETARFGHFFRRFRLFSPGLRSVGPFGKPLNNAL